MPTNSLQARNANFSKNYSTKNYFFMKSKMILLMFILSCVNMFAQNSGASSNEETDITVFELNSFLNPTTVSRKASAPSPVAQVNLRNVNDLIYNTQPSVYYYSGVVKTYGEKPRNLFTDLNSLSNLESAISLKNNIEIVIIKLENSNQLNSNINLAVFSSFKNLKYIYFSTNFQTDANAITNMLSGDSEKYMVFYKVDKGDNNQ